MLAVADEDVAYVAHVACKQRVTKLFLAQGGCMALEDGIVLAQSLKGVWATGNDADMRQALQKYEAARLKRCLPIAVRSRGMGAVLQSGLPPVVFTRDNVVKSLLDVSHFFDHTLFDCGLL